MDFLELDATTRQFMLSEFDTEQASAHHFVPTSLSPLGQLEWPALKREAIKHGDPVTLTEALFAAPGLFKATNARGARVNLSQVTTGLATSEFNTWYVRGLAARLISEGEEKVEVYRAGIPKWTPSDCASHEGRILSVRDVYDGHRARYWPTRNDDALSVPFQPGCHHSIKRLNDN